MIYQQFWLIGEVSDDWRITNVAPIYKKGWKEDPGKYRHVSPTSVPGKIGAIDSKCAHWACEGQLGDQAQPVLVHARQVLLDQPDVLL